jgi:hypothetical protein
MDKVIFLNVGWMSEYSGPGTIKGGGKAVAIQGYGHEMLNFKPFAGRMYGTAVTPGYGDVKLEKRGAAEGLDFVDGVLVVWVAKSKIVGWYRNARVFRRSQPPPKNSGRSYKGHSIAYRMTAVESDAIRVRIIVTHHGQSFKALPAYQTYTREASAAPAASFKSSSGKSLPLTIAEIPPERLAIQKVASVFEIRVDKRPSVYRRGLSGES